MSKSFRKVKHKNRRQYGSRYEPANGSRFENSNYQSEYDEGNYYVYQDGDYYGDESGYQYSNVYEDYGNGNANDPGDQYLNQNGYEDGSNSGNNYVKNAKYFFKGAVEEFLGLDESCFNNHQEDFETAPNDFDDDRYNIYLYIAKGIYRTREKIRDFFQMKYDEWIKKDSSVMDAFIHSQSTRDEKIEKYDNLLKNSKYVLARINSNVIKYLNPNSQHYSPVYDYDDETVEYYVDHLSYEAGELNNEMQNLIAEFGHKQGFQDSFNSQSIDKINETQNELSNITGSNLPPLEYNKGAYKGVMASIKKLLKTFSFVNYRCLFSGFTGLYDLIMAIINTEFLFVPGLNILTLIYRAANLLNKVGNAIKNFYLAMKAKSNKEKWTLFGKSFGGLTRGLVYLLTGGKKKLNKRRSHRKIK